MINALEVICGLVKPVAMRALLTWEWIESGVTYNPLSAEVSRDPYAVYRRLREKDPVHRTRPTRRPIALAPRSARRGRRVAATIASSSCSVECSSGLRQATRRSPGKSG